MDAQVIFPSVICQRRIIKLCFVKDNSKHREESMMRNSNRTQMRGWSGRRDLPVHGNGSKYSCRDPTPSHGKKQNKKQNEKQNAAHMFAVRKPFVLKEH